MLSSLALLLALGLVASACRVSGPNIEPIAASAPQAQEQAVDPNWYMTAEERAAAGLPPAPATPSDLHAETVADPESAASQPSPPSAEQLNAGAAFDLFVMNRFPEAAPEELAALQVVVAGHCIGLVDQESIGNLTQDVSIQNSVLEVSQDECSSMETSSLLIRSSPVAAASWDDAVQRRFARTVWWYDEAAFAARAVAACETGASTTDLELDLELSVSVVVELAAFTTHGDCELMTVADGASVVTTSADDSGIISTNPSDDVTLFFLRASGEEDIAERVRDLYALEVDTGEVTRLTTGMEVDQVALSRDGSKLALLVEATYEYSTVYVHEIASGEQRSIGSITPISDLVWTADGSAIVHSVEADDSTRMIGLLDVATGESAVIVRPAGESAWQNGMAGDHMIYRDSDGRTETLVRHDIAAGSTVDSIVIPYGNVAVGPDGSQAIVTDSDLGEMAMIDFDADELTLTPLASGPGLEAWPSISPDNNYVAYGVGPQFRASDIYITDLSSPETRVNLTADIATTKVGRAVWSPDSQTIFFNDGELDFESMYSVTIDGHVTDLGEIGRPLLVVGTDSGAGGAPEPRSGEAPAAAAPSDGASSAFAASDGVAPAFATGVGGGCKSAADMWVDGFTIDVYMAGMTGIGEVATLLWEAPNSYMVATLPQSDAWALLEAALGSHSDFASLSTDDVRSVFQLGLSAYDAPSPDELVRMEAELAAVIDRARRTEGVFLVTDDRCIDNATPQPLPG